MLLNFNIWIIHLSNRIDGDDDEKRDEDKVENKCTKEKILSFNAIWFNVIDLSSKINVDDFNETLLLCLSLSLRHTQFLNWIGLSFKCTTEEKRRKQKRQQQKQIMSTLITLYFMAEFHRQNYKIGALNKHYAY